MNGLKWGFSFGLLGGPVLWSMVLFNRESEHAPFPDSAVTAVNCVTLVLLTIVSISLIYLSCSSILRFSNLLKKIDYLEIDQKQVVRMAVGITT